ncbi:MULTISPECIES: hypothetical protein [Leptospira]|uniref:Uncharacterized protein n=4 Tax=Leptospira borgpetersenii TaxID=174 RepID=M3HT33_LEPBO|nr:MULTISPECIES: hypothetical protein [Leptospira]EMG00780.1 hypothetical protein LEP1GSC123_0623 [Leptospira borgpetersenii str. 200701203]ABJ76791.1 Hypothetical protein LBJ_2320 [Leptospira borgpetersenii serovar Hardjo-bovis str. JB197]AMX72031.1 hypothetical protein LBHB_12475 [Leptospira borgpetersenii serovar Hardjo]EKP15609.1 hypothetical protein LEP1GSC128_0930 [Leptospira borgpetersenii str. 200801926]EMK14434.1 hypothetical protein LEP1GSC066_0554 [Leptospira sp. serovar Kenya str. 
MSYMAVGSRQILFSDSIAPASTDSSPREVVAVQDNQVENLDTQVVVPGGLPPSVGNNIDVYV